MDAQLLELGVKVRAELRSSKIVQRPSTRIACICKFPLHGDEVEFRALEV